MTRVERMGEIVLDLCSADLKLERNSNQQTVDIYGIFMFLLTCFIFERKIKS